MATDPHDINLNDEQRRKLAEAANEAGKPWAEFFEQALRRYQAAGNGGEKRTPKFGTGKGLISIGEDFDEPLEDFREYSE